jgi:ABC-type antimicrobial peptide transport system permease subunit
MILGDGFRLTILGLFLGLAGVLGLTRFLRSLLFEVQPQDPVTLIGVTGILATVSLLACYFPARRAMKSDPAAILREE